ncbi:RNA polymerase sigma factor [Robertmurraya massiliosenegalensis]|uniref:RNA polymerase sigma factor n=1 Tax=Robertmurraya TaxID=2837507 RepID=UPI0039A599D4
MKEGSCLDSQIEEWYDVYSYPIFKFVLLMVQDYQQAEDLTQETFVKAYKSMQAYKGESSPKIWLFRIAHNVTIFTILVVIMSTKNKLFKSRNKSKLMNSNTETP